MNLYTASETAIHNNLLKWFSEDGSTRTDVIEFPHTQDYEEKTLQNKLS